MGDMFFDQAISLDPCKEAKEPSNEQINLVLRLIDDEKFAIYFFNQLTNPVWAPILEKHGYFNRAPEPIEISPGSFRIPYWKAAEYLKSIATSAPDTVLAIVKTIKTENPRTQELLLEALAQIPSEMGIQVLDSIKQWQLSRFGDFTTTYLGELIERWALTGFVDNALDLYENLLSPTYPLIKIDEKSKYNAPLRFKGDHYWTYEVVKKLTPTLTKLNCEGIETLYERLIRRAIELTYEAIGSESEIYTGYYWRLDIPAQMSESDNPDAFNVLIDGLRDSIIELCKQKPESGHRVLASYLLNDLIIFQRIALYALRLCGKQYEDLITLAFEKREYLDNPFYSSEYQGLLRDQFGATSTETREMVINWIIEGPQDFEIRAERLAKWENRDVTPKDRLDVRENWILYYLSLIKAHLPSKAMSILDGFAASRGNPDTTEKPRFSITSSIGGGPSPVPATELVKMSFEQLHDLLVTYEPADQSYGDSRENLAQTLKLVVQENIDKFEGFAIFLEDPKIRPVYICNYLNGIHDGIKKSSGKLTDHIVELCKVIVSRKEDLFLGSHAPYEPTLETAQLEIGRLFEDVLRADNNAIPNDLLDSIRAILIILTTHPDPLDETDDFDPFTKSLNCIRGVALHAIIMYLLYIDRQQKKLIKDRKHNSSIHQDILVVLNEKLDKTKDPSTAIHSVFGAYFPQLHYLNPVWAELNIPLIFPESSNLMNYWKAAWDAYVLNSNVYKSVFDLLVPQYKKSLMLLRNLAVKPKWTSPHERLAQHIMFAYLADLTSFGHENQLLDSFFENGTDDIRANAIFWLSKVLENETSENKNGLWAKLWRLWQARFVVFHSSADPSLFSKEISEYMRWLSGSSLSLNEVFNDLAFSVSWLQNGFDAMLLVAFAARYANEFPKQAITLLDSIIRQAKEPWWKPNDKDEETILVAAIKSTDFETKTKAIQIVNYRGENGDFRWKDLLISSI